MPTNESVPTAPSKETSQPDPSLGLFPGDHTRGIDHSRADYDMMSNNTPEKTIPFIKTTSDGKPPKASPKRPFSFKDLSYKPKPLAFKKSFEDDLRKDVTSSVSTPGAKGTSPRSSASRSASQTPISIDLTQSPVQNTKSPSPETPEKRVPLTKPTSNLRQGTLGFAVRQPQPQPQPPSEDSEKDSEPSSKQSSASPAPSTAASENKKEIGISAREKRRRDFDAVRDEHSSPAATPQSEDGKKKKKMSRELQSLTKWADWIQATLDKKSAQEKEQAQKLKLSLTPPKKKRRTSSSARKSAEPESKTSSTAPSSSGRNFPSSPSLGPGFTHRSAGSMLQPMHLPNEMLASNSKGTFHEPPANEPIMSVTGFPLDAPPSNKIKKESLWPKKKGTRKKGARSHSEEAEADKRDVSPEEDAAFRDRLQAGWAKDLKTKVNEQLQQPSEIRSSLNLKPFPKVPLMTNGSNAGTTRPGTPSRSQVTAQRLSKEDKRKIKNASPKKHRENPFGFDNPLQLAGAKRDNAFDFADSTKDNDDFCAACGEPGIFLCCERCPKSFHFACCDPPLDENTLPEDEWFCNECAAKRDPPSPHLPGLFSKMLDYLEKRNPTQYKLPRRIRERFAGVSTGEFGEYEDSNYKPYIPAKIGTLQETAPELHYDKNGDPLSCVKCGETGITANKLMGDVDKPIITCEYCPSSWHLDCLDPPLASIKQLGKKWKCPNHADDLIPNPKRRLRKSNVVDVDLTVGFKNDGNIDIAMESSEEDSDDDVIVHIPTPPHLANRDTTDGVAATSSKAQQKLWNDEFVVYRVPERGILIDFMSKAQKEREQLQQAKVSEYYRISRENRELLEKLTSDEKRAASEKRALASLVELKESDFKTLVDVAGKELEKEQNTSDDFVSLTPQELKELMYVKKLMTMKGKEKLMKFLQDE